MSRVTCPSLVSGIMSQAHVLQENYPGDGILGSPSQQLHFFSLLRLPKLLLFLTCYKRKNLEIKFNLKEKFMHMIASAGVAVCMRC